MAQRCCPLHTESYQKISVNVIKVLTLMENKLKVVRGMW